MARLPSDSDESLHIEGTTQVCNSYLTVENAMLRLSVDLTTAKAQVVVIGD